MDQVTQWLLTNGGLAGIVAVLAGIVIKVLWTENKQLRADCAVQAAEMQKAISALQEKRVVDAQTLGRESIDAINSVKAVVQTNNELIKARGARES